MRGIWIGFYLGLFVLVGAACLVGGAEQPNIFSSTEASWVQGIGTVGAIFVAIWVGVLPQHAEAARRRREYLTTLAAIEEAMSLVRTHGREMYDAYEAVDYDEARLQAAILLQQGSLTSLRVLLAEPATKWPTALLFVRVQAIHDSVHWAAQNLFLPRTTDWQNAGTRTSADSGRDFFRGMDELYGMAATDARARAP